RIFVGSDLLLDEILQALRHRLIALPIGGQDDECLSELSTVFIWNADNRALGNLGMVEQYVLNFGTGDVVTGGDDHVVGARLIPEVALLIHAEAITGKVPPVLNIIALLLGV